MTDLIPAWVGEELTPVDKLEAHRLGLRHKAVSVFVMSGREVLIQKRAEGKYHSAGLWANSCCTHPHWDEAQHDCAIRRMRQELGITGLYPSHADRLEYRADVGGGLIEHEVVDVFLADAPRDLAVSPAPEEVAEVKWVDLHDLAAEVDRHPHRFSRWLSIYMTGHKDRIFKSLG
ncbi:NUDIX domain-containing protein [Thioclava sp. GXIMD2076]|uniref:Isopentenyl-diphosphate Delta-isomerase n=1 Tax=Thioclava kandeliae TaxID=3070818 RepID=A0ABV1SD11_9RHOB